MGKLLRPLKAWKQVYSGKSAAFQAARNDSQVQIEES